MHRSRRALIIAILAALAFACFAMAAAPQSYTLRLHSGQGDKATYAVSAATTAKLTVPGEEVQKGTIQVDLKCAAQFLGLTPDDQIMVHGQVLGGTMKSSLGKESQTAPIPESVTNYLLTSRGDMKEIDLASGEPTFVTSIGWVYTPDDAFLVAPFPAHPVQVGQSWKAESRRPAVQGETGETPTETYNSKVLGQVTYAGRNCLKIQTDARLPIEGSVEAPDGSGRLSAKGSGTRTTIWLFDPKEGLVMKADATIKFDVTETLETITEGKNTARVAATMTMHSRMTEYNGKEVPAE